MALRSSETAPGGCHVFHAAGCPEKFRFIGILDTYAPTFAILKMVADHVRQGVQVQHEISDTMFTKIFKRVFQDRAVGDRHHRFRDTKCQRLEPGAGAGGHRPAPSDPARRRVIRW